MAVEPQPEVLALRWSGSAGCLTLWLALSLVLFGSAAIDPDWRASLLDNQSRRAALLQGVSDWNVGPVNIPLALITLAGLIYLWRFATRLDGDPAVAITEQGLTFHRYLRLHPLDWTDVREVSTDTKLAFLHLVVVRRDGRRHVIGALSEDEGRIDQFITAARRRVASAAHGG